MTTREPTRPSDDGTDAEPGPSAGMLRRLGGWVVLTLCAVFAVIGAVAQPSAGIVTFVVFTLVVIGPLFGVLLNQGGFDRWSATAGGALGSGAAVGLFLAVSGIVIVFGQASTAVLPLVLLAVAVGVWTRRRGLVEQVRTTIGSAGAFARRLATGPANRRPEHTQAPPETTTPRVSPTDPSDTRELSTAHLCQAWRESYWLLVELSPGPLRDEVHDRRGVLLDELERRDPAGFAAWLDSVPRAGTDPGRYLHRNPCRRARRKNRPLVLTSDRLSRRATRRRMMDLCMCPPISHPPTRTYRSCCPAPARRT